MGILKPLKWNYISSLSLSIQWKYVFLNLVVYISGNWCRYHINCEHELYVIRRWKLSISSHGKNTTPITLSLLEVLKPHYKKKKIFQKVQSFKNVRQLYFKTLCGNWSWKILGCCNSTDEAQLFSWFVCATYLLARIFLLRNLMIFQVFTLEGIYWSFSKLKRKSHHIEFQDSYELSFVKLLCIFCNGELMQQASFQILR